jgi:hypothetical protein
MIAFNINGRLGNQMFQLAAAYTLAIKHKTKVLPNETSGQYYVPDIFINTSIYPWHWRLMHVIGNLLNKRLYRYFTKLIMPIYYNSFKLIKFQPRDYMSISHEFHNLPNNTNLDGYFQSEFYFNTIKNTIHHLFKFKEKHLIKWETYIKRYEPYQNLIAMHIRLSDYKQLAHLQLGCDDLTLPSEYYTSILKKQNLENSLIIVMSDEPETVTEWFKEFKQVKISRESQEIDLLTLTKANVCILSHSTFSWWGAWLNNQKNNKIYIPKYFLGFKIEKEIPEYIIPKEWIQVEVSK